MPQVVHTVISLIADQGTGHVDAFVSIAYDKEPFKLFGSLEQCSPEFLKRAQDLIDDIAEP